MTTETITQAVRDLIAAPSCCQEAKEAAEAYLKAIGTPQEKAAAQALIGELEEDVCSIDDFIAFVGSETGAAILGGTKEAACAREDAEKAKAQGERYCTCPACQAGGKLLDHKDQLI